MKIQTHPDCETVFRNYPEKVREKMYALRGIIEEVAVSIKGVVILEETLKWGEPSFLVKGGSTLRIDWKPKTPTQYALYFKCTSRLVETFRIVFAGKLQFEGNRAIFFQLDDRLPKKLLMRCIETTFTYHTAKQLPLLGL